MGAYYNEFEPFAAQWLRNLIAAGHIAPGDVDERSIEDVHPNDLRGYSQCHFFAGIGIWSYALRCAGWADDRPVWTGSCPCQPFSAAGKGLAFADERHLWPAWFHLIQQRRPPALFGEQVASASINAWVDLVQADLEAMGYSFGCVPFPSASVGAPHIRDRAYWVGVGLADANHKRLERWQLSAKHSVKRITGAHGMVGGLGITNSTGRQPGGASAAPAGHGDSSFAAGNIRGMADDELQQRPRGATGGDVSGKRHEEPAAVTGLCGDLRPGPINGFWRAADWIGCTDGKFRPVEPGTQPLAYGAASRVGRLRAYGNAINAVQAQIWIETVMECMP